MSKVFLVGDIGGTNARLAIYNVDTKELNRVITYSTAAFFSLELAIKTYLEECGETIKRACLAVACPVTEDKIEMTNHSWKFSISEMKANLGLISLEVINDFQACALSIPFLKYEFFIKINSGNRSEINRPKAVFGPGTGLGVTCLFKHKNDWLCLPGEGGHAEFSPQNELEFSLFEIMKKKFKRVSAERVMSGAGIKNIYQSLCEYNNLTPDELSPEEISARALKKLCPMCEETVALFFKLLGRFAGNLALLYGATGGVYVAGGIVPQLKELFLTSEFIAEMHNKGRFSGYVANIPVSLIIHPEPGLMGSGIYMSQQNQL